MSDDNDDSWGFALVISEDHHAVFPLPFDEPVIPQQALSDFNRGVRAFCENSGFEYTHDTAVKCAVLMLLQTLLPVAEGTEHETDWRQLTASLMFISNYTNFRYFMVTSANTDLNVERLNGYSLREAEDHGKRILDAFQDQVGHPVSVYYVVDGFDIADDGVDNAAHDR